MNNFPDMQRIFLELKSKIPEQRENASEELKTIFKKNPEFSDDVLFFLKLKKIV